MTLLKFFTPAVAVCIVLVSFLTSDGFFANDEVIYYWSAFEMAERRSLTLMNGNDVLNLSELAVDWVRPGPNGLVPQYPVGMAFLGGAAVVLGGIRGLVLLNAVAAALTLIAVRALARNMFSDERVAQIAPILLVLCTFWLEYAFGIWPHSVSVFFITLAFVFSFRSLRLESVGDSPSSKFAFWAGCSISLAFLFRTDAILAIPVIAFLAILYSTAPLRSFFFGTLGILPGLAIGSSANAFKFGTWNPLSYGVSDGGVDLQRYVVIFAILVLIFLSFAVSRYSSRSGLLGLLAIGISGLAGIIFVPEIASYASKYFDGALSLIIDIRNLSDSNLAISRLENGIPLVLGETKRALAQSVPWIGVVLLVLMRNWPCSRKPSYAFTVLLLLIWTAPFAISSWFGGRGSNMRYFLPLLPVLSIICARLLVDLLELIPNSRKFVVFGILFGTLIYIITVKIIHVDAIGADIILSFWVFLALTSLAAVFAIPIGSIEAKAKPLVVVLTASLVLSFFAGAQDFWKTQNRRALIASINETLQTQIHSPSVVIGYLPFFGFQISRAQGLIVEPELDRLQHLIDEGFDVWVTSSLLKQVINKNPNLIELLRVDHAGGQIVKLGKIE